MKDVYPSRHHGPAMALPRLEPCAWKPWSADAPLTREQYQQWCHDGFLVLEGLFSAQEVALFREELGRLSGDTRLLARPEAVTEVDTGALRSLFAPHRHSAIYDALTRDPRLLRLARFLLDDEVYIHQARVNFKPGLSGKGFYWHSDFETWHAEDGMPRMRALSASISLTDNTPFNGPLMLVPGSHRTFISCPGETPVRHYEQSLKAQQLGTPPAEFIEKLCAEGGIRQATGKAGSLVLFDCNVLHGSSENISPMPRSNIFFVFNSVHNSLRRPYAAPAPRPEYLAARGTPRALREARPDYAALATTATRFPEAVGS